jgi:ATP-dependent Clp protease, protease subunit
MTSPNDFGILRGATFSPGGDVPWPGVPLPGEPPSPGRPQPPGRRPFPGEPEFPGQPQSPGQPQPPGQPWSPGRPDPGPVPPTRVWLDPQPGPDPLQERLLAMRIVLAGGVLDDAAATRLSAQLLTLDADGDADEPVRLELQNLRAELPAVITVMGILDVMRVRVHACASGDTAGPALALLASCPLRSGYPNATFTLTEPSTSFEGTATAVAAREQQVLRMMDTFYYRLAEVTGREPDEIREDARRGRVLTAAQAIGYGLIQDQITREAS